MHTRAQKAARDGGRNYARATACQQTKGHTRVRAWTSKPEGGLAGMRSPAERASEGTMMSLGGNMMSAPVLLALLVSIFESAAWRKTGTIPYQTDEAVHCAMNLFLASAPQGEVGELGGDDNAEPDQGHMCKRLKIDDM